MKTVDTHRYAIAYYKFEHGNFVEARVHVLDAYTADDALTAFKLAHPMSVAKMIEPTVTAVSDYTQKNFDEETRLTADDVRIPPRKPDTKSWW